MNIIDLDKVLLMDMRFFLKEAYKKESKNIEWDDFAAWNILIDKSVEEKAYFASSNRFFRKRSEFKLYGMLPLLDENNNVVVSVEASSGIYFEKNNVSYYAFGPFIAYKSPQKFFIPDSLVDKVEDKELEYLQV